MPTIFKTLISVCCFALAYILFKHGSSSAFDLASFLVAVGVTHWLFWKPSEGE